MKFIDISGKTFGKLKVIGIHLRKKDSAGATRIWWKCTCECGENTIALKSDLVSSKKTTCGCSILDRPSKHGLCNTGFYRVWSAMKDRCLRKTD